MGDQKLVQKKNRDKVGVYGRGHGHDVIPPSLLHSQDKSRQIFQANALYKFACNAWNYINAQ